MVRDSGQLGMFQVTPECSFQAVLNEKKRHHHAFEVGFSFPSRPFACEALSSHNNTEVLAVGIPQATLDSYGFRAITKDRVAALLWPIVRLLQLYVQVPCCLNQETS